jgi:hypothetical protein
MRVQRPRIAAAHALTTPQPLTPAEHQMTSNSQKVAHDTAVRQSPYKGTAGPAACTATGDTDTAMSADVAAQH